jgi:hypothetical protein
VLACQGALSNFRGAASLLISSSLKLSSSANIIGLEVLYCEIETSWDQVTIESFIHHSGPRLDFMGQSSSRKEMLDDRLEDGLSFHRRGEVVGGWLLASGLRPIPATCRDCELLSCGVMFWDSLGREAHADAELSVVRARKTHSNVGSLPRGLCAGENLQEPTPAEESGRRHLELRAQEVRRKTDEAKCSTQGVEKDED